MTSRPCLYVVCMLGIAASVHADFTHRMVTPTTVAITGYTGAGGAVTIPSKLAGYPVVEIDSWAFNNRTNVTSVVIPDGITSIGSYAFNRCLGLTEVSLGRDISAIGDWAFRSCSNLVSYAVAEGNPHYSSIDGVLFNSERTILVQYPLGKSGHYEVPEGVTLIGQWAFRYCYALTDITLSDSVLTVGQAAFYGCTALTNITFGSRVSMLSSHAFFGCTALTDVSIGTNVTTIGNSAFDNCSNLVNVSIPDSVTAIGGWAFLNCTSLTNVALGNNVRTIGEYAFAFCYSLAEMVLPDSVTSIQGWAFLNCTNLSSIMIAKGVDSIGTSAFSGCYALSEFTVVTENPRFAARDGVLFNKAGTVLVQYPGGKTGSYEVPEGVTALGNSAFSRAIGLTDVSIPESVSSIGTFVFFLCTNLTNIQVAANNPNYMSMDGVLFNRPPHTLIQYPAGRPDNTYWVPDSVLAITNWAFAYSHSLTNVIIPNSVTNIGFSAFSTCSNLVSVTIGQGVTSIGSEAFFRCPQLTHVMFRGHAPSTGVGVFNDSTPTLYYRYGTTGWTSVFAGRPARIWPDFGAAALLPAGPTFQIRASTGQQVIVQARDDPRVGPWVTIATGTASANVYVFSDTNWAVHPARTYRVVLP